MAKKYFTLAAFTLLASMVWAQAPVPQQGETDLVYSSHSGGAWVTAPFESSNLDGSISSAPWGVNIISPPDAPEMSPLLGGAGAAAAGAQYGNFLGSSGMNSFLYMATTAVKATAGIGATAAATILGGPRAGVMTGMNVLMMLFPSLQPGAGCPECSVGIIYPPGGALSLEERAASAANAARLSAQLTLEEAESAFTANGELSADAIATSKEIIPSAELNVVQTGQVPTGFAKFTTRTYKSPAGPFQVHFYMNPTTRQVFYDLDYKLYWVKVRR